MFDSMVWSRNAWFQLGRTYILCYLAFDTNIPLHGALQLNSTYKLGNNVKQQHRPILFSPSNKNRSENTIECDLLGCLFVCQNIVLSLKRIPHLFHSHFKLTPFNVRCESALFTVKQTATQRREGDNKTM